MTVIVSIIFEGYIYGFDKAYDLTKPRAMIEGGVKIPLLGYLDPHPSLHFENLEILFTLEAVFFQLYLKRIFRDLTEPMELCNISRQ